MIEKIVSGGQTGIDRAALDVAIKLNIKDSDGTLILIPETLDKITDGTILTIQEVKEKNKPFLIISLAQTQDFNFKDILSWTTENHIKILNIAGPRESQSPGIYNMAYKFIENLLLAKL